MACVVNPLRAVFPSVELIIELPFYTPRIDVVRKAAFAPIPLVVLLIQPCERKFYRGVLAGIESLEINGVLVDEINPIILFL